MNKNSQMSMVKHPNRQARRTQSIIYQAFIDLLAEKNYNDITVQEIIDRADIGRATFYNHYASKDLLLEQLCQELFHHIFRHDSEIGPEEFLCHVFRHFQENQHKIASLLLAQNDYFIRQLTIEIEHDVYPLLVSYYSLDQKDIPEAFLKHFVCSSFISSLEWFLREKTPPEITDLVDYFLKVVV
ncbi:TetR/AcrR family transcriptional regulator [Streptococcus merionis]|uniref:TetR/AcrR family transcriptional regulator n=1 Tax=Streptococcus merionis TaxID=400065 RepID=UPI0035119689